MRLRGSGDRAILALPAVERTRGKSPLRGFGFKRFTVRDEGHTEGAGRMMGIEGNTLVPGWVQPNRTSAWVRPVSRLLGMSPNRMRMYKEEASE
jgi:hypothetical protein